MENVQLFENGLSELVVLKPEMKNYTAFFIPVKSKAKLLIMSDDPKKFKAQLDCCTRAMNENVLIYKSNNFLVTLPMHCLYFKQDWISENPLVTAKGDNPAEILTCFKDYTEDHEKREIQTVIDQMYEI